MIYRLIINRQNQKTSRTMINVNSFALSQKVEHSLDNLELSALFIRTKGLMRKYSSPSCEETCGHPLRQQIQEIMQFIANKIADKSKLCANKFVSLLSVLIYANTLNQNQVFPVQYIQRFYQNLAFYAQNVFDEWNENKNSIEKRSAKINLSILLCSLSSLVGENSKNIINVDVKKTFSPAFLRSFLSTSFPNELKFMMHYKTIMVYLSKHEMPKPLKKLYIRSLGLHLASCDVSNNFILSAIYLINKCIESNKLTSKINEIWSEEEIQKIVAPSLQIVLGITQPQHIKLVLQFSFKLISKLSILTHGVTDARHFLKLFTHIYKNGVNPDRLAPCLQQILSKMSNQSRLAIFKQISADNLLSTLDLEILQNCAKKLSLSSVIEIVSSGELQKLMMASQGATGSTYKKYLTNKTINNIIENAQENEDLHFILRNLHLQSVGPLELKPTH